MNDCSHAVSIKSAVKRYGSLTALNDVTLDISRGEFFGLLGPNGAGKSTMMSLISGLRGPDAGTICLAGRPARDPEARRKLGLVPQGLALYPELTAAENLRIFGGLNGLKSSVVRGRTDEALDAVQLTDRRNSILKTLSGGMLRRLNIAAALLHRPELLLCDEPTVGVDPQSRYAIFELLQRLNKKGMTIIYSTHYMEEASRLCSRIGIIERGKILALGSLDELLRALPFEEEIRFPATPEMGALCAELAGAGELALKDGFHCFRPRPGFRLSAFYLATERYDLPSRLFAMQQPTLESVFLQLTGKDLRE